MFMAARKFNIVMKILKYIKPFKILKYIGVAFIKRLIKNTSQTYILCCIKRSHYEKSLTKVASYPAHLSLVFIKKFDHI